MDRRIWLLTLGLGCSDYGLTKPGGDEPGAEDPGAEDEGGVGTPDGEEEAGPSDSGRTGDGGGGDTGAPPEDDGPPDEPREDCEGDASARWRGGEISVLGRNDETESGILSVSESGWFHVYDTAIAESEDRQQNESAFLRVPSSVSPDGAPLWSNCEADWVVVDTDNGGPLPDGTKVYMGTFWFDAGDNELTLHHYCTLWREGVCESLHVEDDPDSTCDTDNANSVHFVGEGLCLERTETAAR